MRQKLFLNYLPAILLSITLGAFTSGWLSFLFVSISVIFFLLALVMGNEKEFTNEVYKTIKIPKGWNVLIIIGLFFCYSIYGTKEYLVNPLSNIYNKSVIVNNQYNQKAIERKGFYDKLWKTFLQKEKITNINKDVFIEVAKIQMENRKDGQNVTWKWVQENSQIPYSEYVKFYSDLSSFIEDQRKEYYALEKECQALAIAHNLLIDTFPNNYYNKLLGVKKIEFSDGFLSDSTNKIFTTKTENLK